MISRFSSWFVARWRVTVLLLIGALVFGAASYQYLLKREGFPPIAVPVVLMDAVYPADDVDTVLADVTTPLERAAKSLDDVAQVTSQTTGNVAVVQVQLTEGTDTDVALRDLRSAVDAESLPEGVTPNLSTINAGSLDGKSDLILALYAQDGQALAAIQEQAKVLATELADVAGVQDAAITPILEQGIDPTTGRPTTTTQRTFNRVAARDNGKLTTYPAVSVGIVAEKGTNIIDLSHSVRSTIDGLLTDDTGYDGYAIAYTGDVAPGITSQIDNLESNLIGGLFAVLAVIFLAIGLRPALIIALFLPLVLATTFGALYLLGYTLNTLTLFAVLLVLGLVADDAIIVVEAIEVERRAGHKGIAAIRRAIDSIGAADISGTITTVLVFAPMAFISGVLGQFIFLIPVTVIISLVLSLVIALTIIPMVSNLLIPAGRPKRNGVFGYLRNGLEYGASSVIQWTGARVGALTRWYLRTPWRSLGVIALSLGIIAYGMSFATSLPFQIFPTPKDGDGIYVQLTFPDGTTLAEAEDLATSVDEQVASTIGDYVTQGAYLSASASGAFLQLDLTSLRDRDVSATTLAEELDAALTGLSDVDALVSVIGAGPPPSAYAFSIALAGDDTETLRTAAEDVRATVLDFTLPSGATVTELVPTDIERVVRTDGVRQAKLQGNLSEGADTAALIELEQALTDKFTPEAIEALGLAEDGVSLDLGAEGENLESFESAIVALGAAFLLLYHILVLEFNSFLAPFLILLAVPFGVAGVIPGLAATDNGLSFFVMVGLIALAGTTVNNSIMLLEFTAQAQRDGKHPDEAMAAAVAARFRPILATTATTVIALIPLATSDPIWESLAYTLIFGLTSSALLILFAFPAFYGVVEGIRIWTKRTIRRILGTA